MTRRPRDPAEMAGGEPDDRAPQIDPMATTGPGLPDEALAEGETLEDELVPEAGKDRGGVRGSPRSR
jgi:hypothetical protein